MSPRSLLVPLRCSFLCALLAACDAGPRLPRNLVLVTLDTTRRDALLEEPRARALAPRIAELVAEGVQFPRAYTVAPLTLPAHASLLTGLLPPRHGVRDNGRTALPAEATTLAEWLGSHGFETAAFVSALVLERGFGLDQGFERYDQPPLGPGGEDRDEVERSAATTVRAAAEWLAARAGERPFFLWVHLYDAHVPYEPLPTHLARAGGDAYRGEIAALDDAVGALLDALEAQGFADETLVALTADHGESLGEHGEPTHGALCYEAAVRVPLVLHFPGTPPVPKAARLASLVDVPPTLLARLGLPVPAGLDGFDLFASVPASRGVYFESYSGLLNYGWSPLVGWLDGRGKYLHSSAPEFYRVEQDPLERDDRAASTRHERELALGALREVFQRPALAPALPGEVPRLAETLAALGYARGEPSSDALPTPFDRVDGRSPKEGAAELEPLLRAHALFEAGRFAECRPLVERLHRANSRHRLALDLLALSTMHAGEYSGAAGLWRERLALSETADGHINLALCLLELGDAPGARRELEAARALAPEHPEIEAVWARLE